MRQLLPIPGLVLLVNLLTAQVDSTSSDTVAIPVDFSLRGAFYYQPGVRGTNAGPEYFHVDQEFYQRLDANYPWREPGIGKTDNPLYHGAGYIRLDAVAEPIPEARLQAGIIGEMRGMSYGVRDTRNMIVYPEFLFSFSHALPILGDTLHSGVQVGDRPRFESLLPLTFYNTDVQGSELRIGYRWLEFAYEKASGDGAFGIGLNINDADHWAVRTRGLHALDSTRFTLQAGGFDYPTIYYLVSSDLFITFDPEFAGNSPRARLYSKADLESSGYALLGSIERDISPNLHGDFTLNYAIRNGGDPLDHFLSRSAFLARLRLEGAWRDGEFSVEGAYRYYGGLFNAGFRNDSPSYRQEAEEVDNRNDNYGNSGFVTTYANSIGPYLYPLSNLDYPFSRWAVFAEYQDLKDVTGWTLYARGRWRVIDRFFVSGMLDLNLIVPEKTASALYPFWRAGVGYEPYPSITLSLEATNQTMNLDKHYPTFYQIDGLSGQATIRWRLRNQN